MNTNLLSAIATVPVLAGSIVLNAGSASAAAFPGFSNGDTLELNGAIQLDNQNFAAGNAILFCPPSGGGAGCATPNDTAVVSVAPGGNDGGFEGYNQPNPNPPGVTLPYQGNILSLDPTSDAFDGTVDNIIATFVTLPGVNTGGTEVGPDVPGLSLSLDLTTFSVDDSGLDFTIASSIEFEAFGDVTYTDPNDGLVKTERIFYDFTAQGLQVLDDTPGSELTAIGSYSGTVTIAKNVPEPSSAAALLALSGLTGASLLRNRKQNQVDSL